MSSRTYLVPLANQVCHAQSRPNSPSLLVLRSVREIWVLSDQTERMVPLILDPESSKDWQQVSSAPSKTGVSSTFSVLLLDAA